MFVSLLLAAGASRRFGGNKLLVPLPDGRPLALAAAEPFLALGVPVLAVVRPGDDPVAELLSGLPGIRVSVCPTAEQGLGHSLAWGVAQTPTADGWLVGLADMPWLCAEDARAVLEALDAGASLAAPIHAGRRGHPVAFSARWRQVLLALEGDQGGQVILGAHPAELTLVPCAHPGVVRDVDRPADLFPEAAKARKSGGG